MMDADSTHEPLRADTVRESRSPAPAVMYGLAAGCTACAVPLLIGAAVLARRGLPNDASGAAAAATCGALLLLAAWLLAGVARRQPLVLRCLSDGRTKRCLRWAAFVAALPALFAGLLAMAMNVRLYWNWFSSGRVWNGADLSTISIATDFGIAGLIFTPLGAFLMWYALRRAG